MFRPQIQKTKILVVLAIINLAMVYIAHQNTQPEKAPGYDIKIKAALIDSLALDIIKEKVPIIYKGSLSIIVDAKLDTGKNKGTLEIKYDPNLTGLITDTTNTEITTGTGNLKAKQTTIKKDFAALIVDYFINESISKGDTVAVGMTGSMPGANIALLSACKAMAIHPVIISSMGASQFGATDTNFTWIDMEQSLKDTIFNNISVAYSLGGKGDCLKNKEDDGRNIFKNKIKKYNAQEIGCNHTDINSLAKSIDQRMEIYEANIDSIINYKAYINIGGGAASVGVKGKYVFNRAGYLSPEEVKRKVSNIPEGQPKYSVIKRFADINIPTIHILRIKQFVKGNLIYGEIDDNKIDPLEDGSELYQIEKYKLFINIIALLISLGSVFVIGIISHNEIKNRMQSYEPESIL